MKHAAKSSQFKFAFITFFKFTFIEPFLQLAFFLLEPLIQFILLEPFFILPLAQPALFFELEQQAGFIGQVILFTARPPRTFSETPEGEPAYRLQTAGRQGDLILFRPQTRLRVLPYSLDRYRHRQVL